jgi:hypothetical protein
VFAVCLLALTLAPGTHSQSVEAICKDSRPDCAEEVKFFSKIQVAVQDNDHKVGASQLHYPHGVRLEGHRERLSIE